MHSIWEAYRCAQIIERDDHVKVARNCSGLDVNVSLERRDGVTLAVETTAASEGALAAEEHQSSAYHEAAESQHQPGARLLSLGGEG